MDISEKELILKIERFVKVLDISFDNFLDEAKSIYTTLSEFEAVNAHYLKTKYEFDKQANVDTLIFSKNNQQLAQEILSVQNGMIVSNHSSSEIFSSKDDEKIAELTRLSEEKKYIGACGFQPSNDIEEVKRKLILYFSRLRVKPSELSSQVLSSLTMLSNYKKLQLSNAYFNEFSLEEIILYLSIAAKIDPLAHRLLTRFIYST